MRSWEPRSREARSPGELGGVRWLRQPRRTWSGKQDGCVFLDEPERGRKEDPTRELEPRSLGLGSAFLEMGAASLLRGLGNGRSGSWEVLGAGSRPHQAPLCPPGSGDRSCRSPACRPGPGLGLGPRSHQPSSGRACHRRDPTWSPVPWCSARPSLLGSGSPWHPAGAGACSGSKSCSLAAPAAS